jgi:hypothetical protein
MKRLVTVFAILLLSEGLVFAQATNGAAGSSVNPTLRPASPGDVPVGHAPGMNPNNGADLSNRSNPQDMTQPNASNPQNLSPSQSVPVVR